MCFYADRLDNCFWLKESFYYGVRKVYKKVTKCYKVTKGNCIMRTNPHILEINTRAWLARLEAKHGRRFALQEIPDEYWREFKALGFDAVWLMGVWKQSPKAGVIARENADILAQIGQVYPDFKNEDVIASPYAIYEYEAASDLGGEAGLRQLHDKLNAMGMDLFLDFVANHTAIDCPLVDTHPEFFINTGKEEPRTHKDWFFQNAAGVWIAHGRDPYFAPWTDSAQLNYFNPKTKEFMLQNLLKVASLCDGVRCDMAMLTLNKVHRDTWWEFIGGNLPKEEFWSVALQKVREERPDFKFIAEVYWGLEWEIQQMGFDYTYDKVLYDRLRFSDPESIKAHLGAEHLYQMRSIRFTANHDEEESLKAFGRDKSLAASTIIATLPGARMIYFFQMMGHPVRVPIQYVKDFFREDAPIRAYYEKLLKIASKPAFHGGQWSLTDVRNCGGDGSSRNILCWTWKQMNTASTVLINYSAAPAQCLLKVKAAGGDGKQLTEEFSGEQISVTPQLREQGFEVKLNPFESKIFTYSI